MVGSNLGTRDKFNSGKALGFRRVFTGEMNPLFIDV